LSSNGARFALFGETQSDQTGTQIREATQLEQKMLETVLDLVELDSEPVAGRSSEQTAPRSRRSEAVSREAARG
jgi:hypothetical protein